MQGDPTRTLKDAMALAAETFGARRTFFVTNGTSTANKTVHQALLRPDDIEFLLNLDCEEIHGMPDPGTLLVWEV